MLATKASQTPTIPSDAFSIRAWCPFFAFTRFGMGGAVVLRVLDQNLMGDEVVRGGEVK